MQNNFCCFKKFFSFLICNKNMINKEVFQYFKEINQNIIFFLYEKKGIRIKIIKEKPAKECQHFRWAGVYWTAKIYNLVIITICLYKSLQMGSTGSLKYMPGSLRASCCDILANAGEAINQFGRKLMVRIKEDIKTIMVQSEHCPLCLEELRVGVGVSPVQSDFFSIEKNMRSRKALTRKIHFL